MSWFNFSRTYYFGNYDANLFIDGPTDPTVISTIQLDTNFAPGFSISPEYIQYVYYTTVGGLPHYSFVNDAIIHSSINLSVGIAKRIL